ncbi:hypothetical protein [Streptosporangium sp. G12]
MTLEHRIAERLYAALRDLDSAGVSVLGAESGLASGPPGMATIRLTVEDVADIAAKAARETP